MYSKNNYGVSPVIGVILMVAVTVALVALVTVVVFDIGDDVSEPADITVNTDETGTEDASDNELTVEVVRNENVDSLDAQGSAVDGSKNIVEDQNVGTEVIEGDDWDEDSEEFNNGNTVELIATIGDNEEIVTTVEMPGDVSD